MIAVIIIFILKTKIPKEKQTEKKMEGAKIKIENATPRLYDFLADPDNIKGSCEGAIYFLSLAPTSTENIIGK